MTLMELLGPPDIDHLLDHGVFEKLPCFVGGKGLERRTEEEKEEGQGCGYSDQNDSRH